MRRFAQASMLVICLLISVHTAIAEPSGEYLDRANGFTMFLSGPGAGTADTIYCGQPVTFNMKMDYTPGDGSNVGGMANGFRVYSPDGAIWTPLVYDTAGGLCNYFNLFCGTGETTNNGSGADTCWVGGSAMTGGVPDGFYDVVFKITTQVNSSQAGKTLCIDSSYWPPAGTWVWATDGYLGSFAPGWSGPHCFNIVEPADPSGDVSCSISGPGAGTGDTIICGQPVTFNINMQNTTGDNVLGMTNGFRVYSPDAATWSPLVYDTAGGLDSYFDLVLQTGGFSVDGSGADTCYIAGAVLMSPGVPNGYDDVILRIQTQTDVSQAGKTLCIDSSWFPPNNPWMWNTSGGTEFPDWSGPHCYYLKDTTSPSPPGMSCTISGPGAGTGDTIICGQPVTWNINMHNTIGDNVRGMTNGFRVHSPDGATWSPLVYDTAGGLDAYFDLVLLAGGYSIDGSGADTCYIAGSVLVSPGVPNGYDDIILTIQTQANASQTGKTLCIDSSYFPPSGTWLWAPGGVPDWSGPHCYYLKDTTTISGACCYPDPTGSGDWLCVETDQVDCENNYLGVWEGPGTQCWGMEACCLQNGDCVNADALCCVNELGGTPQGGGTACTAPIACCMPDSSCQMLDSLCCLDLGGIPQGPGSACGRMTACCFGGGIFCATMDSLCCEENGGTVSPFGAPSCLGDVSPPNGIDDACEIIPTGACCLSNGSCQQLIEYDCLIAQGTYMGDGTMCLGDNDGNGIDDACYGGFDRVKMHYLQLPDVQGWDVISMLQVSAPGIAVADDWRCVESGHITDIYWWGSWYNGAPGILLGFNFAMFTDIPADPPVIPYSRPGEELYRFDVPLVDIERTVIDGSPYWEGWYEPYGGFLEDNHQQFEVYHARLPDTMWLEQVQESIYWISISAITLDIGPFFWGWKSSIHHFNDDATWSYLDPPFQWEELYEPPDFQQSMDMAFVLINDCCIGTVGSTQLLGACDPLEQTVDISDLTNMIDHLFISYTPLCCIPEADIEPLMSGDLPDGAVDIADLTAMIDHLFINFPALPPCP